MADKAKDLASPIRLWGRWLPIVFGVVGAVGLIAGIFLMLRGPRRAPPVEGDADPYRPAGRHDDGSDGPRTGYPNLRKDNGGSGGTDDDVTQHIPRVTDDPWRDPDTR